MVLIVCNNDLSWKCIDKSAVIYKRKNDKV